ncbi:hypothetical protein V6N13_029155 [Hibiscus sabdariffa]
MRNEKISDNKYARVKDFLFNTKMRALVWVNASKTCSIENVDAWWENPSTFFCGWQELYSLFFIINVSLLGESVGCGGILRTSEGVLRVLFFGPVLNTGLVYVELLALKIRVDVFIEVGYGSDRAVFGI